MGLTLTACLSFFFSVLAEESGDKVRLMLASVCWWIFALFWFIVLGDYWFMFLMPLAIGLVYFIRFLAEIVDVNRIEQAVARLT